MPMKKLDDAHAGDVLAQDITNPQGAVLVKAGTPLEEKHLRLLRMWGVEAVRVAGEGDGADAAAVAPNQLDHAEAEVKRRFGPSLDNEVMAEILRVAVTQIAAREAAHG